VKRANIPSSKHNVQLPDEYDQINKDLQLFWGISPADLRRRIEKASKARDTYTLKVRGGKIEASGVYKKEKLHDRRKEGQMALMEPIVDLLPDMSIVYSVHDTPNTVISWEHHQDILMHIDEGDCE
jgi:hypothetical protein